MAITISPIFSEVQQNIRDIFGYVLGDDPEACEAIYGTDSAYGVICPVLSDTQLEDPTRLLTKFILTGKSNIPATATRLYATLTYIHGHIVGRVQEEYGDNTDSEATGLFKRKVISHRKEKYSIQFYYNGAHDTAFILNQFLNDPLSGAEIFNLFGMSLTEVSDVRNVNEIISAEWEERAEMDFCVNFSSTMEYEQVPFFGGPIQSFIFKYIDEIHTQGVFEILDENGRYILPTISASCPERISANFFEFVYTKMSRVPHVAIIDFVALPHDATVDENTLFEQVINDETTGVDENGNIHRFSPSALFTYPEGIPPDPEGLPPQFTITQVVSELEGQSLTLYCENGFNIYEYFNALAAEIVRPDKPIEPSEPVLRVSRADFVAGSAGTAAYRQYHDAYENALSQYRIDLVQYQIDLAEYIAFSMPDVPRGRASYPNDAAGQAAYDIAIAAYTEAIDKFTAFRRYVYNNRYALYIVNLTTEKFVALKANVFAFSDEDSVTFDSGNWVPLSYNLENEDAIPDMLNSLNDDRVIIGLFRLNLFRSFE